MVVIETTIWVDYLADRLTPQTDWLDRNLRDPKLCLTDLILCEVLQGVHTEREFASAQAALQAFKVFPSGSVDLAIASARNYRTLRSRGITVRKTVDCLIATFCIRGEHSLLHNDRDYVPFEQHLGLHVIHP